MLAFATPLSHNQSAEGPSSTSVVIRSRSTPRPCPHSSSSVPTSSHPSHAIQRASSKRSSKSSSTPARPVPEDHRNEPSLSRNIDRLPPPTRPPPPQDERNSSSDPHPPRPGAVAPPLQDIHEQDPNKLLQLLASLLQQIASANDQIHSPTTSTSSPAASPSPRPDDLTAPSSSSSTHHAPIWSTLTSASRQAFSTSTSCLTFHARNIPTISLEAYLLRILKYCPTTNEVFLSLLVYFDRMSKLAFDATGKGFAIDSFNVHRLIIAGVTVASKFFSDVFYTNSRYAKVSLSALLFPSCTHRTLMPGWRFTTI